MAKIPELEKPFPHAYENFGFVSINSDLKTIYNKLVTCKVTTSAKASIMAPFDVLIPAGSTNFPTKKKQRAPLKSSITTT